MSARKLAVVFVLVALVAVLATACGGGGSSGGATLTVTGTDDLKFNPTTLTVKAGQSVTLNLVNNGKVAHNFVINEAKVRQDMPAGKTVQVTFTAPAAGTYQFICDIPGHKEAGMVGTLTVQ